MNAVWQAALVVASPFFGVFSYCVFKSVLDEEGAALCGMLAGLSLFGIGMIWYMQSGKKG